jgi:hypothetical protein
MDNRFGPQAGRAFQEGALIWLPEALLPSEYPKTASDILKIAERSRGGVDLLNSLAAESPGRILLIIGAPGNHGPCLGALTIPAPTQYVNGKNISAINNGFRTAKTPKALLAQRFWGANSGVTRAEALRADAAWIHGRGKDRNQEKLSQSKVIILGCGSLGAPVASQLAMAGVGHLLLIDPDELRYANVGRHTLGAEHVGDRKAQAVAELLKKRFPHSRFEFKNLTWQKAIDDEPNLFDGCSMILSLTGDWGAEDALNVHQLARGRTPTVLYGWIEAHACAGHVVAITARGSGCLACGFSDAGQPLLTVAEWPEPTLEQEPACGGVYQPYGPIELGHTVELVSELTLDFLLGTVTDSVHRMWACRRSVLERNKGVWTASWLAVNGARPEGGCISERAWPRRNSCSSCS